MGTELPIRQYFGPFGRFLPLLVLTLFLSSIYQSSYAQQTWEELGAKVTNGNPPLRDKRIRQVPPVDVESLGTKPSAEAPVPADKPVSGDVSQSESQPDSQLVDGFDGVQPTWKIQPGGDFVARATQRRSDVSPRSGRRCEFLSVFGSRGGERVLATHSIPPSAAIAEFRAHLWVRGNREGFQLIGRVRLPRTLDENNKPLSFDIFGDVYSSPGLWQQLVLRDVETKISDAVRALRIKLGKHVDGNEAYLDQVAVNLYGGAGRNQIFIDDLAIEAAVPVQTSPRLQDSFASSSRIANAPNKRLDHPFYLANLDLPTIGGSQSTSPTLHQVQASDWVARAVVYHGESFEFLRELGFNTILLDAPANKEQLANATALGLWLVAPPAETPDNSVSNERVLAWSITPTSKTPKAAWEQLRSIKSSDPARRPILGVLKHNDNRQVWGRLLDLTVDRNVQPPSKSNGDTKWLMIGEPLVLTSRWLPLRNQIWDGVVAGYDGFVLQTTERLDHSNARHTRNLAELFNGELNMLRPWIANRSLKSARQIDSARYHVELLSDEHTSLVMVRPRQEDSRHKRLVPTQDDIEIPTSKHRDVFRVEPGGLSPVAYRRVPGGIRISLNPSKPDGILLLTDRSAVVQQMSRHLRSTGPQTLSLLEEVIRAELLELDRRMQYSIADAAYRAHLRTEVHELHDRIAWLLESSSQSPAVSQTSWNHVASQGSPKIGRGKVSGASRFVSFRELDHVLGQLERVHHSIATQR